MADVGLLTSPRYLQHDTGSGHPESPDRLRAIQEHLEAIGLARKLTSLQPVWHERSWVEAVHDPTYIRRVERTCRMGQAQLDSPDTGICPASYEIALLAVDGALTLVDAVLEGRVRRGFGVIRPPGHHAEREVARGFCLFNNVAIAARYAQRQHDIKRIAIVDWDVHHGNGTQHAFEESQEVLYASIHQWPLYPGTGRREEQGTGNILNIPLDPGAGDAEYLVCFHEEVLPALRRHRPELLLISAGFDAHRCDPLAQMEVTEEGYRRMTELLVALAEKECGGRIVSLLEGGYHLPSLARSVQAHLEAMMV